MTTEKTAEQLMGSYLNALDPNKRAQDPRQQTRAEREKILAMHCLLHGIESIRVTYEGSGDSGGIDEVEVFRNGEEIIADAEQYSLHNVEIGSWAWNYKEEKWEKKTQVVPSISLQKFIEDIVYERLSVEAPGFEINEGGFGHWVFKNGKIDFESWSRYEAATQNFASVHAPGELGENKADGALTADDYEHP